MTTDGLADDTFEAILAKVAAPRARAHVLAPGTVVAERFRIERRIGAGGMGTVYVARDVTLARDVAIKLHHAAGSSDRLRREAVAMAQLAHPNVVTVFEVGEHAGHPLVVMEYVAGTTLRDWLKARERGVREIVDMLAGAGEGLAASHAVGLVHRDFKPENVLIGAEGRPRVGDFGLARAVEAVAADAEPVVPAGPEPEPEIAPGVATVANRSGGTPVTDAVADTTPSPPDSNAPTDRRRAELGSMTETGTVLGTPAYMAPEQLGADRQLDARVDQFAFCVTAWEALYGARPFAGATLAALEDAIAGGRITAPPSPRAGQVPAGIRAVLERGLAHAPADRFADMAQLIAALRAALELPRRRRRRRIALAGALAAVALAIVLWQTVFAPPPPPDCAAIAAAADPPAFSTALADALRAAGDTARAGRVDAAATAARTQATALAAGACRRARLTGEWTPALEDKSRACLDDNLAALAYLLRGSAGAAAAHIAIAIPPTLATCARAPYLERMRPSPTDPAARSALVAARAELAIALATPSALREPAAAPVIARLSGSPAHADPEIAAGLALVRGEVALGAGDIAGGVELLTEGYYGARAIDAIDLVSFALTRLISTQHELRHDATAAEIWVRTAIADADRSAPRSPLTAARLYLATARYAFDQGDDAAVLVRAARARELAPTTAAVVATALSLEGSVAFDHHDLAAGKAAFARAIATGEADPTIEPTEIANLYMNQAVSLLEQNDSDAAIESATRAVGLRATEGTTLEGGNDELDLAAALLQNGRDDEAEPHLARAREIYVALYGEHSLPVADVDSNAAKLAGDRHDYPRAVALATNAVALDDELVGTDALETASALYNLAASANLAKDYATARVAIDRNVAITSAKTPGTNRQRMSLTMRALITNSAGDYATALAAADAARAIPGKVAPEMVAWALAQTGRALIGLGRGRGVQPLLAEARAIYQTENNAPRLSEIDDMLAHLPRAR